MGTRAYAFPMRLFRSMMMSLHQMSSSRSRHLLKISSRWSWFVAGEMEHQVRDLLQCAYLASRRREVPARRSIIHHKKQRRLIIANNRRERDCSGETSSKFVYQNTTRNSLTEAAGSRAKLDSAERKRERNGKEKAGQTRALEASSFILLVQSGEN